jgi:hypothetical protein
MQQARDPDKHARRQRWERRGRIALLSVAIGAAPVLSAVAGSLSIPSVSIPVLRDNAASEVAKVTSPVTDQTDKVIGPASSAVPQIGETTAPINDSAMFRANSALQNQIASGSAGYIQQ